MAELKQALVPDIGDFSDVPVIEVLVSVGDAVVKDQGLITLESDKATLEVPSSLAGVVRELKVKVGDTLSKGSVVALIEAAGDQSDEGAQAKQARADSGQAGAEAAPPQTPKDAEVEQAESAKPDVTAVPRSSAGATSSSAPGLQEARVPDIGDFSDVPVIEVLVAVGDTVVKDQGLITLESDKATLEVPTPLAGVVKELKVKVGDTLSKGSVVALIEGSAPAPASNAPTKAEVAPQSERAKTDPDVEPVASGSQPDQIAAASMRTAAGGSAVAAGVSSPPLRFEAAAVMPDNVPYASPAVRLFARELGVDLTRVTGSARGGRITKSDVQGFVKSALGAGAAAGTQSGMSVGAGGLNLLPWPKVDFAKFGPTEVKPLARIKRISGANLARNWAMIPHVTQHDTADITELEALRVALNAENQKQKRNIKLTMLAFLMKAVVAALKQFPDFNASLDAAGENLTYKQYFHIGFAADTPNGLVVPVVRDCDSKGINQIAQETAALAKQAREGKLGPADMLGGCFTISSLGGIGGTAFTPIINAPEVAILGVSKSTTKPVWDGKAFQPRLVLPLSLSYDHRVIDGASAARFAAYLAELLGDLRRVLL